MFERAILFAAGAALAVLIVGTAAASEQDFPQIERGRYLATAADCFACHTVRDGGKPYAGGRPIETPFGVIVSPNITPDFETGIGAWTDEQFDNAIRRGVRPDGSRLYPAMPYTYYTKMSHDDVTAMRAYFRTLEPVRNPVTSNKLPFPFNIRTVMRIWDWINFAPNEWKHNPQKSAAWNRGGYLVEGPGHCGACHTPKNIIGADKTKHALSGATLQGWLAPAISNDDRQGLGRWSADDIAAFLKTGHNRFSAATGPMAEEITDSSSKLTDSDLAAIAAYLKDQNGKNDAPSSISSDNSQMTAGAAIYRDQCSACHQLDGKGVPNLFPSLASSSLTHSDDPQSVLHLILRGARSVGTKDEPTAPGMPSYAKQLDDAQIAAVATYIRNAWGEAAPAVEAGRVKSARDALAQRPE